MSQSGRRGAPVSEAQATTVRVCVVLGVAVVMGIALSLQLPHLNGPWYWDWPWKQMDAVRIVPWMLLGAVPFAAAQYSFNTGRLGVRSALILIALSAFLLELAAIGVQGPGFDLRRIVVAIQSPVITSYFTDALQFGAVGEGLAAYPERMEGFHLHSINKPPGPILYYLAFSRMLGPGVGAMVGGLLIGILAAGGVVAAYGLARRFGAPVRAAFAGASYFALCPGLVLFFPEFDQAYPLLACGLLGSFSLALERGGVWPAFAFGVCLWVLLFFSFGLLVLGALCAGLCSLEVGRSGSRGLGRVLRAATIGCAVVVAGYLALWAATGYDPIATFHAAMANQAAKAATLGRPWPATVFFDLTDFALGTGWLSFVLVGCWMARRGAVAHWSDLDWLVVLCLLQILVVAVGGLIPVETARVWLFMMPLLMVPVGLELAEWTAAQRSAVYAALWGLMVLIGKNMVFLGA